jgi:hypothetical protein
MGRIFRWKGRRLLSVNEVRGFGDSLDVVVAGIAFQKDQVPNVQATNPNLDS